MSTKIYVGGIARDAGEEELKTLFSQHGDVISVSIIKDNHDEESKSFGFVEMPSAEAAQKAITLLHGKEFAGCKIAVSQARPQQDRGANFRTFRK